jgi:cytochrome bd-type quinol oxidase subunit 1
MTGIDLSGILSYGVIGLGFLLALLAYRLLGREQQKETPRKSILIAIHVFMIFSVVLCLIGFGSEIAKATLPEPAAIAALKNKMDELEGKMEQQELLIERFRARQRAYEKTYETTIATARSLVAPFPASFKKPVFDVLNNLKPRKVEE